MRCWKLPCATGARRGDDAARRQHPAAGRAGAAAVDPRGGYQPEVGVCKGGRSLGSGAQAFRKILKPHLTSTVLGELCPIDVTAFCSQTCKNGRGSLVKASTCSGVLLRGTSGVWNLARVLHPGQLESCASALSHGHFIVHPCSPLRTVGFGVCLVAGDWRSRRKPELDSALVDRDRLSGETRNAQQWRTVTG